MLNPIFKMIFSDEILCRWTEIKNCKKVKENDPIYKKVRVNIFCLHYQYIKD